MRKWTFGWAPAAQGNGAAAGCLMLRTLPAPGVRIGREHGAGGSQGTSLAAYPASRSAWQAKCAGPMPPLAFARIIGEPSTDT